MVHLTFACTLMRVVRFLWAQACSECVVLYTVFMFAWCYGAVHAL